MNSSTSSSKRPVRTALRILAGALVLHALLYIIATFARPVESRIFETDDQFAPVRDTATTLILGDSHPKCDIDAAALGDAFNYAVLGGVGVHADAILTHLIQTGYRPQRVLLPMDTHSLAWQRNRMWESVYWSGRLPFPILVKQAGGIGPALKNWTRYVVFPYAGTGDTIIGRAIGWEASRTGAPMEQGSIRLSHVWSPENQTAAQREADSRAAFLHDDYRLFNPDVVAAYEHIFALCEENAIDVVLIRYPAPQETINTIKANVDIADFDTRIRAMAPPGTRYLDYFTLFAEQRDFFADTDHMNATGAAAFTEQLKSDLAQ